MLNVPVQTKDGVTVVNSVDLAKVCIASHTKSGRKHKSRHYAFVQRIMKVLGEKRAKEFAATFTTEMGNTYTCYMLPEAEACLVVMSYSCDLSIELRDLMRDADGGTYDVFASLELANKLAALKREHELAMAELELELEMADIRKRIQVNNYRIAKGVLLGMIDASEVQK